MINDNHTKSVDSSNSLIITAGSNYLDIDAYACCVAMRELFDRKGQRAVAFSKAPCNYSVCSSLIADGQIIRELPPDYSAETSQYIIVDVSDPDYIRDVVPLECVVAVYDHHTGFEDYWKDRIGKCAHIEFVGAAATLVLREWNQAGLLGEMSRETTLLLIAAFLDNTLNLTSANTTPEDLSAFQSLCKKEGIDKAWCAAYFSEVQDCIEADLENALIKDVKIMRSHPFLPTRIAQLCVWDAERVLKQLERIRQLFNYKEEPWMLNIIDISHHCSCFVCDNPQCQAGLERVFDVHFHHGIANTSAPFLRKEIIALTANAVMQ